jgi:hypothetical protein
MKWVVEVSTCKTMLQTMTEIDGEETHSALFERAGINYGTQLFVTKTSFLKFL